MDTDSALIEAAFTFGKHCGKCQLTPDGARMFARVFDLTVRAGIANSPKLWESRDGRAYILGAMAQIGKGAARLAGRGQEITADIFQQAANRVIDDQRERLGMPRPDPVGRVLSKFCFAFVYSDLYEPAKGG